MGGFLHRHRGLTPWLLLLPGIAWLAVFFVVPLGYLAYQSLQSGTFPDYEFDWAFEKDGELSEDELARAEKDLDKVTHAAEAEIDAALAHKEQELLEV